MPRRVALLTATVAALVVAAPQAATAALPKPKTTYSVHDHQTPGDNWHVQMKTTPRGRGLASLVVHADRCGAHTPFARSISVNRDGITQTYRPLDPRKPSKGNWFFQARFTERHRVDGYFRIITPDCDTGPMVFVAHSGRHQHVAYGPSPGQMPDLDDAKPRRLEQASRLWRDSWKAAAKRFRTYDDALALGFKAFSSIGERRPLLFHLRHAGYTADKRYYDARRVESLVYYRGASGPPVLVAFMYRFPTRGWPPFGKPLLGWHTHGNGKTGWNGVPNQMTHVWLTADLRSGLANCMPVEQLEQALPDYEYVPTPVTVTESAPCPPNA